MVSGRDLADALADQLDLPLATAADFPELPLMEERLSSKFLRDAQAVPLREDDEELALAIADPTDSFVISAVQMASGKRVRPYIAAAQRDRRRAGAPLRRGQVVDGPDRRQHPVARRGAGLGRRRAPEGPRLRGARHPPREPDPHQGVGVSCLRHPHRALREPAHRALPHRRRAARGRVAAAPAVGRDHLAREDHGLARHRRAPPAAGRAHQAAHPGQGDRPARLHRADDARRERGDAHPRQGRRAARLRLARLRGPVARSASSTRSTRCTASCS